MLGQRRLIIATLSTTSAQTTQSYHHREVQPSSSRSFRLPSIHSSCELLYSSPRSPHLSMRIEKDWRASNCSSSTRDDLTLKRDSRLEDRMRPKHNKRARASMVYVINHVSARVSRSDKPCEQLRTIDTKVCQVTFHSFDERSSQTSLYVMGKVLLQESCSPLPLRSLKNLN